MRARRGRQVHRRYRGRPNRRGRKVMRLGWKRYRLALSGLWAVEKADDGNPWDTSYLPDE